MRANPGGQLAPAQVVGRDRLIAQIWRVLDRQSLLLSAERRLGKTSILKKMLAEPRSGWKPIFRDLEKVHSPIEFVETVIQDTRDFLGLQKRTGRRLLEALQALGGTEIGGILKLPSQANPQWKTLLVRTIEDLVEDTTQDRIVFFWDEVPLMLYNVKKAAGEQVAMEMLDTLRSLRQTHVSLRMIFTGSIGLHNVLTSLKRAGYANDPTNDMYTVDVPALDLDDATALARNLLDGESLRTRDLETTTEVIARTVDCLPFFIHHVVDSIAKEGNEATPAIAADVVARCLTAPQDPWHLRYYRERIDTYYESGERRLALMVLDIVATTSQPLTFAEIRQQLSETNPPDPESLRSMLDLVQRDHYLLQDQSGRYRFRFEVIARHWRLYRGLSEG